MKRVVMQRHPYAGRPWDTLMSGSCCKCGGEFEPGEEAYPIGVGVPGNLHCDGCAQDDWDGYVEAMRQVMKQAP